MLGKEVAELVLEQIVAQGRATPEMQQLYNELDRHSQMTVSEQLPGNIEFFSEKLMACRLERRIKFLISEAMKGR